MVDMDKKVSWILSRRGLGKLGRIGKPRKLLSSNGNREDRVWPR